jgi:hypothetical protein
LNGVSGIINEFSLAVLKDDFRLEPQNTQKVQGDNVVLECGPPKGIPEPSVFWKKNGQKIDFEINKRMRIIDGGNLQIQDVRQSDDGRYQCVAKNIVGIRESNAAFLKVYGMYAIIR